MTNIVLLGIPLNEAEKFATLGHLPAYSLITSPIS